MFELQATLDGAQQANASGPAPVTTSASGTFVGTYDSKTSDLTYTITFTGLTPTNAHIHTGAPGIAGPVTIRFLQFAVSPITGTYKCSPAVADDLLNNRMYVNIHTTAYSGGEIRGDIKQK
ncbi:CHRD domain-containing protein [Hymenobacter sp.]|uniref:CHRD domain-containing protein n=1 Tax=Hymenobacter sp. TaxID=1898978 RepID=UPI00286BB1D4|nr:CHRD domain-containing protein [Hymenobacter sp.]